MYKEFKCVHIAFENCEHVEIPAEDIRYMSIKNLKDNVDKYWNSDNMLSISKSCDSFLIGIEKKSEYQRILKYSDITQIHIYFTENTDDLGDLWFYVPWGEEKYHNTKQTTRIEDDIIEVKIIEK